jgi:hypothetical protein
MTLSAIGWAIGAGVAAGGDATGAVWARAAVPAINAAAGIRNFFMGHTLIYRK